MRIKMLTAVAGDTFSVGPNEETDNFTKEEAERFIKAGLAEEVKPAKKAKK